MHSSWIISHLLLSLKPLLVVLILTHSDTSAGLYIQKLQQNHSRTTTLNFDLYSFYIVKLLLRMKSEVLLLSILLTLFINISIIAY